jgi:prepilin-type N-terminal cleavage/methylation domain-containing protein
MHRQPGPWAAEPRRAFTLVELLVVVSIIALLISILLPSLRNAREGAKAVVCGAQLHDFSNGLNTYTAEYNDWIPGRNTTGFAIFQQTGGDPSLLSGADLPFQTFEWLTPLMSQVTEMPNDRAKKFRLLVEKFSCPSVNYKQAIYPGANNPDVDRFLADLDVNGSYRGCSYLMPVHFQYWGQKDAGERQGQNKIYLWYTTKAAPTNWEVRVDRYKSKVGRVGSPGEKVAIADGMRYLNVDGDRTYDVNPKPTYYGATTTSGAWWRRSTAYGDTAYGEASGGQQLPLTYRHKDEIEALFFDGHVDKLSKKQSHKIDLWYPRGGVVEAANEGFTDYATYENGYVIR